MRKKARLTSKIVEDLLRKTPEIWAKNGRSKTASVQAMDGDFTVELRVNRMPAELVSEICEEKMDMAELIFWDGPEQVKMPLSRRIHARAVEIWQSLAMSPEELETAKQRYAPLIQAK